VEDQRTKDSDETDVEATGDDCPKCEQLRDMLDASIQVTQQCRLYLYFENVYCGQLHK